MTATTDNQTTDSPVVQWADGTVRILSYQPHANFIVANSDRTIVCYVTGAGGGPVPELPEDWSFIQRDELRGVHQKADVDSGDWRLRVPIAWDADEGTYVPLPEGEKSELFLQSASVPGHFTPLGKAVLLRLCTEVLRRSQPEVDPEEARWMNVIEVFNTEGAHVESFSFDPVSLRDARRELQSLELLKQLREEGRLPPTETPD